jgi:hypothetical protein
MTRIPANGKLEGGTAVSTQASGAEGRISGLFASVPLSLRDNGGSARVVLRCGGGANYRRVPGLQPVAALYERRGLAVIACCPRQYGGHASREGDKIERKFCLC